MVPNGDNNTVDASCRDVPEGLQAVAASPQHCGGLEAMLPCNETFTSVGGPTLPSGSLGSTAGRPQGLGRSDPAGAQQTPRDEGVRCCQPGASHSHVACVGTAPRPAEPQCSAWSIYMGCGVDPYITFGIFQYHHSVICLEAV